MRQRISRCGESHGYAMREEVRYGIKAGLARQPTFQPSSMSRVPGDEQMTRIANIESKALKRKHSVVKDLE